MLWGVFYGILLIIEKLFLLKWLQKAPKFVGHIYAGLAVLLGWVLFAFEDIGSGAAYLKAMFGGGAGFVSGAAMYQLLTYLPLILICAFASTPLVKRLYQKISEKAKERALLAVDAARLVGISAISVAFLISGSYNPFLYFRF